MPKRKLVKEESTASSELSPPPEDLVDGEQAVAGANAPPSKKRKGEPIKTEAVEGESNTTVTLPSKKRVRKKAANVKAEPDPEAAADEEPTPKKKRAPKKKVEDEPPTLDADGNPVETKPKPKRKSKAEKQAELITMPLATRTLTHTLHIGAHEVSADDPLARRQVEHDLPVT